MDKNRAFIEIQDIFWGIKYDDKTPKEQKELIKKVLEKLQL